MSDAAAATAPAEGAGTSPVDPSAATEGQAAGTEAPPPPTKAQLLEKAALEDAARRKATRDADLTRAKRIERYADPLGLIEEGKLRDGIKALVGDKYSAALVLELMQDFPDPDSLTVEERAQAIVDKAEAKRLEGEKAAKDAAATAARERADGQINGFIKEAGTFLHANVEQYEAIETYYLARGERGADELAEEIDKRLVEHFIKTGESADPKTILDQIEADGGGWLANTRFRKAKPKNDGPDPEELDDTPILRVPPTPTSGRKLSLDEEIERDLAEADLKSRQQLRVRGA